MKAALFLLLALVNCFTAFAQNKGKEFYLVDRVCTDSLSEQDRTLLDSVLALYHHSSSDTFRIKILMDMAEMLNNEKLWPQYNQYVHEKSSYILDHPGNRSEKELLSIRNSYAKSLHNIGYIAYNLENDVDKAMLYYDSCLKMEKDISDKLTIAATYNNIAIIHQNRANISLALEYYTKSLKIEEEIGNKATIANALNNLGSLYTQQNDTIKAREYIQKSIDLCKEAQFDRGYAFALSNMAALYREREVYSKALEYFISAVPVWERTGERTGLAYAHLSIGHIKYKMLEKQRRSGLPLNDSLYRESMHHTRKSLGIYESLNSKNGASHALSNLGQLVLLHNDLSQAEDLGRRSLVLGQEIGFPTSIRNAANLLYDVYKRQNRWKEALSMHELFIRMRDSVFNEETQKNTFKQQAKYEYEKQQALKDAEHQAQLAIAEEGKKRQQIVTWSIGVGLLLVIAFAAFVFNRLQVTRKQKAIIEEQKVIVEVKNKHITDSINYARRIQNAMLPAQEEMARCLGEHFIFYSPRDIVSGDFYWISDQRLKNGYVYFAVADCTGHGVPGALMSMIGNTLLNEIVNEKQVSLPSQILQQLHQGVSLALHHGSHQQDDGMDISLCRIHPATGEITFAGANHSLIVATHGAIREYKGDYFSIGSTFGQTNGDFKDHIIRPEPGSMIYMQTDGLADQLGGEKGKKLLSRNLQKILAEIAARPAIEQEQQLKNSFEAWRGHHAQLDDILLAGFRAGSSV